MIFWEQLLKTSLLGTDRQNIDALEVPLALDSYVKQILESNISKEEKLLKISSLTMNFRKAGQQFAQINKFDSDVCEAENLTYANQKVHQLLQTLFADEKKDLTRRFYKPLLDFLIDNCIAKSQIIQPDFLNTFFEGLEKIELETEKIRKIVGKRGIWLAKKHPKWQNFFLEENNEELWKTGTLPQRRKLIAYLRKNDPKLANNLLDNSWKSESANNKQEFLNFWQINLGKEDQNLLEKASQDRSEKVRFMAVEYLQKIPNSLVSRKITEIVASVFSKKTLAWQDDFAELNFAKSQNPNDLFNLMLARCPLEKLAQLLQTDWKELLENLKKGNVYSDSAIQAIVFHKNTEIASYLLQEQLFIHSNLLRILPYSEAEKHYLKLFQSDSKSKNHDYHLHQSFAEHLKDQPNFVFSLTDSNILLFAIEKAHFQYTDSILYLHADSLLEAYKRLEQNPKGAMYGHKTNLDQIQQAVEMRDKIKAVFV